MEQEQICGNCAHWLGYDSRFTIYVPQYINGKIVKKRYAPCECNAVEADAGESVTLLAEYGHCQCHSDAFEPGPWYLEELEEQHLDEAALYGLKPGIDFPATLNKSI